MSRPYQSAVDELCGAVPPVRKHVPRTDRSTICYTLLRTHNKADSLANITPNAPTHISADEHAVKWATNGFTVRANICPIYRCTKRRADFSTVRLS